MGLTLLFYISIYLFGLCSSIPENVYGRKGSTYTFICPHRKSAVNNVVWDFENKAGTVYAISDGTLISPSFNRTEIVGDHSNGEYNIKLSDLKETDEGIYRCSVSTDIKEYYFVLSVAPSGLVLYDVVNNTIRGTEGNSLTINCTAVGGHPEPYVRLEVDSQVSTGKQSVQYEKPVLQKIHDKQLVKCQATSDALDSPLQQNATLYLYLKPSTPMFNVGIQTANETQNLIVSCRSNGSRPAGEIYWKIKTYLLTSGFIQENVFDILSDTYTMISTLTYTVDRSYNGQPITCGVTHQTLSQTTETTTILTVNYPPNVTVSGVTYNQTEATRTVTCNPVGNPATYTFYTWQHRSRYGILIRELGGTQNGILTLPNVPESDRYQDAGEYVCTAGNGIGDNDGIIQQKGNGDLTINAQPVFTKDNEQNRSQHGEIGKQVDIYIYIFSVPKYTTLKWLKDKREIKESVKYGITESTVIVHQDFHGSEAQLDGYRVTLTIHYLNSADFGNYTLQLNNGYGQSVEHTVVLELEIPTTQSPVELGCSDQDCTSHPIFVIGLTLIIATVLIWTALGSILYRRKVVNKRDHLTNKETNYASTYDEVGTSKHQRKEDKSAEIQLDQYETLGAKDKTTVYEQLGTKNSQLDQYESLGAKEGPALYEHLETNNS